MKRKLTNFPSIQLGRWILPADVLAISSSKEHLTDWPEERTGGKMRMSRFGSGM